MNGNESKKYVVDVLFVLILFGFFTISSVMLIALGASVYRSGVDAAEDHNALRTSYAYVLQKTRQGDISGDVTAGYIGDVPAILLNESVGGVSYTTYLYLYDGSLCELFTKSDLDMPASAGTKIRELEAMDIVSVSDDMLRVDFTENGGVIRSAYIKIRSESFNEGSAAAGEGT